MLRVIHEMPAAHAVIRGSETFETIQGNVYSVSYTHLDVYKRQILNLHYFKRDSYISVICQASRYAGEGRKADADTHLAAARSQETETGISGYTKDKRTAAKPFFLCPKGYYFSSVRRLE